MSDSSTMRITFAFLTAFVATSSALTCYKSDRTVETCSDGQTCAMDASVMVYTPEKSTSYWKIRGCKDKDNCTAGITTENPTNAVITTTTTCCMEDNCNKAEIDGSKLCYTCSNTLGDGTGCTREAIDTADMYVGITTCKGSCQKSYDSATGWVARGCPQECTEGTPGTWEVNCCTTDLCNHGMQLTVNSFLILVTVMAFTFFKF